MPARVYSAVTTGSYDINTDKLAIEITAAANTTVKIKKIRILHSDGTTTTTADYCKNVKIVRESVAGTGGTSYTPIKLDPNSTASGATVKTGVFTVGTVSETIDTISIHSVTDFLWSASDEDDKIVISNGGILGIILNPAG